MISRKFSTGQSLIEVVIVLGITVVVVVALVIVVLTSLKNAKFAQNQARATKYAQEALEQIKAIRDRDEEGKIVFQDATFNFSGLWDINMSKSLQCASIDGRDGPCYFKMETQPALAEADISQFEDMGEGLSRQIIISDTEETYGKEKKINVRVFWEDSAGKHESNLQTVLTHY